MTKKIVFNETSIGHVVKIDDKIVWLIRKEEYSEWLTYKSDDGGKGFKLIPANDSDDTLTWGHKSLNNAKAFVANKEI